MELSPLLVRKIIKLVCGKPVFSDKYRNRDISAEAANLEGDELIDYVNNAQSLWTVSNRPNSVFRIS